MGGLGLGSPPAFPATEGDAWELAGPQKMAAETTRIDLKGSPRLQAAARSPGLLPAMGGHERKGSRIILLERLLGERAHQELQQRRVESLGHFPRLAPVRRRARPRHAQAPTGDRGGRRACLPQHWGEPAARSTQHGLAARDRLSPRPSPAPAALGDFRTSSRPASPRPPVPWKLSPGQAGPSALVPWALPTAFSRGTAR